MDDGGGQAIVQHAIKYGLIGLGFYALPLLAHVILCHLAIDLEALNAVVGTIYPGKAPSSCGASGPEPEPPEQKMQPKTPFSRSPIQQAGKAVARQDQG